MSRQLLRISGGSLLAYPDNTQDIGAAAATRPRNLYLGGQALAPTASMAAPGYAFGGQTTSGLSFVNNRVVLGAQGVGLLGVTGTVNTVSLASSVGFGWTSGDPANNNIDTFLYRDGAANTLALRNGANPQTLRIYNTYTDASNYTRMASSWFGNQWITQTEHAGAGTATPIVIRGENGLILGGDLSAWGSWQILPGGHLTTYGADNTYDIGASGANRPRNVYVGGIVDTNSFRATGAAAPSNGVGTEIIYNAGTGVVQAYDRTTPGYRPLNLSGSDVQLAAQTGQLLFTAAGTVRWSISALGHLLTAVDNTYDIGASGANRPRNLYIANRIAGVSGVAPYIDFATYAGSDFGIAGGFRFLFHNTYDIGNNGTNQPRTIYAATSVVTPQVSSPFDLYIGSTNASGNLYLQTGSSIVEQRNGVSSQTLRLYDHYVDAANYQRLSLQALNNVFRITTENAGSYGVADLEIEAKGNLFFRTGGSYRWYVDTNSLRAFTDNAYDIGAAGANRPRNLYLAGFLNFQNAYVTTATAGAASALPGPPALYFQVKDSTGATRLIPAYNP